MRCPNCQKTILDNIKICPYCGHEVSKKSKPQDMFENPVSPMGGLPTAGAVTPAEHHEAVHAEVKKRHWQRWVFYGLIILIVGGSIALVVRMSNDSTRLLVQYNQAQADLDAKKNELAKKDSEIQTVNDSLKKAQDDLNAKAEQYKKDVEAQGASVKDLEQCKLELSAASANVYNLILQLGTGISNKDLARIALADANLNTGLDSDNDGLSDEVEKALGTDPNKADTDGDGFNDKAEVIGGFDPLVAGGKLPLDQGFANRQKGRLVLQVEGNKEAWYISPSDGKRYFLGLPGDGYKAMRSVEFWTKDFSKK